MGKSWFFRPHLATRKFFFFLHGEEWNLRVKHQVLVSQSKQISEEWKSHRDFVHALSDPFSQRKATLSYGELNCSPYDRHKTKASYSLLSLQVRKWKMKAKEAQLLFETSNLCQNPGCWWHHRDSFRAWVLRSYTRAWNLISMCTMFDL